MKYIICVFCVVFISFNLSGQKSKQPKLHIEFRVPFGLHAISKNTIDSMFPNVSGKLRPTKGYANKERTVFEGFAMVYEKKKITDLPEIKELWCKQLIQDGSRILKKEIKPINGKSVLIIEHVYWDLNHESHCFLFCTLSDANFLIGTFSFLETMKKEWVTKAIRSINTLVVSN